MNWLGNDGTKNFKVFLKRLVAEDKLELVIFNPDNNEFYKIFLDPKQLED